MKFVFVSLMCASVFIVATHQYFHDQPMPWLSPYSSHPIIDKYQQPFIFYYSKPRVTPEIYSSQNDNFPRDYLMASEDNNKQILNLDQQYIFPDTQSRVKGLSNRNPSPLSADLNEQQNARFLFNLFANSGTYSNPFFKTATFTITTSVSLTNFVTCVPSFQMANGAAAVACRRKRSADEILGVPSSPKDDNYQQLIDPSETEKLIPTDLLSSPQSYEPIYSSKDDEESNFGDQQLHLREKRFLFANKNQFVVSSTTTAFSIFNSTVTVTRNLINPPPAIQCVPQRPVGAGGGAAAQGDFLCIACLPAGYVVCAASG